MEEIKKFTNIQNWLGKLILMLFATIWLASNIYPHIMKGFMLTEREIPEWGTLSDYGVLSVTTLMILGGVYLNTLLDFIKSKFIK
tara:strand:+ start:44191 stop:44445 length:255 start_codon:yes stop_codon:yes gene_type:complete